MQLLSIKIEHMISQLHSENDIMTLDPISLHFNEMFIFLFHF